MANSTTKIEQLIEDIYEFVESSRSPLGNTNKVVLQRAELYDMLDELKAKTPEEVKEYQKIIANRERILEDARQRANAMIDQANAKVEAIVDESEVVRRSNQQAQEIVNSATVHANSILEKANEDAAQIRMSAISYTNDLLTNAEGILQNAYKNTKARYDLVFEALQEDLDIIASNKKELETNMPLEALDLNPDYSDFSAGGSDNLRGILDD